MHDNIIPFSRAPKAQRASIPSIEASSEASASVIELPINANPLGSLSTAESCSEKRTIAAQIEQKINAEFSTRMTPGLTDVTRARRKVASQMAALNDCSISTDIGMNERLRKERGSAWGAARVKVKFLLAQLDMRDATLAAQHCNLPEALTWPRVDPVDRLPMVENWRKARMVQLLTPAPDAKCLRWKRHVVERMFPFDWVGVNPEQVEKAIADDEAFLKAHPTRHCRHRPK
jgi:hypothetical protein